MLLLPTHTLTRPISSSRRVVSLFSILAILGLVLPSNAILAETVTVTNVSTGGVVSGGTVTGDSSASVHIRNVLEGGGAGNARVEIRVEKDGVVFATSTERNLEGDERLDVDVQKEIGARARLEGNANAEIKSGAFQEPSNLAKLFEHFKASIADMVGLVFFFWQ